MSGSDEMTQRASGSWSYRSGVALVVVTSLLTLWTTIVRDDGNGLGFLMLVLAVLVGAFAAWFRPAGMARAMLGVAIMQALLGIAVATAPNVASIPGGSSKVLLFSAFFTALWLVSAALFRTSAKKARADSQAQA